MSRLRTSARPSFVRDPTSIPSSVYVPRVGRSRQPRMFIIVDLPDPLVPTMATNSPDLDHEVHVAHGADGPRGAHVVAGHPAQLDEGLAGAHGARLVAIAWSDPSSVLRVGRQKPQSNIPPFFFLSSFSSVTTFVPVAERVLQHFGVDAVGHADGDDLRFFFLVPRLVAGEQVDAPLPLGERRLRPAAGSGLPSGPSGGGRLVAERGVGELQGPLHFVGLDRDRGRHAGAELLLRVVDQDDRRVRDDPRHCRSARYRTCCTIPWNCSPGKASTTASADHPLPAACPRPPRRCRS